MGGDFTPTMQARQHGGEGRGGGGGGGVARSGVVLGDLVDVAAWGNVPCVSKIDMLDFSTVY
jgi:hypothetical protein